MRILYHDGHHDSTKGHTALGAREGGVGDPRATTAASLALGGSPGRSSCHQVRSQCKAFGLKWDRDAADTGEGGCHKGGWYFRVHALVWVFRRKLSAAFVHRRWRHVVLGGASGTVVPRLTGASAPWHTPFVVEEGGLRAGVGGGGGCSVQCHALCANSFWFLRFVRFVSSGGEGWSV